jgi:hypothetical protein
MKYYLGEIETYIGESCHQDNIRFKTAGNPQDCLYNIAKDFWGDEGVEDQNGMIDFGDRSCCVGRLQELDAKTYNKIHIICEINKEATQ